MHARSHARRLTLPDESPIYSYHPFGRRQVSDNVRNVTDDLAHRSA